MTTSPPGCRPGENRSAGRAPRSLCSSRREVARGTILAAYPGVNEVVSRNEREHVAPLRFPPTVRDLMLLGLAEGPRLSALTRYDHRLAAGDSPTNAPLARLPAGPAHAQRAATWLHDALGLELPAELLDLALTHRSYAYENGG